MPKSISHGRAATPRQRWSRERIVAAMEAFRAQHGRPPTTGDWKIPSALHPDPGTVSRHFGSWAAALEEAGFTPRRIEWTDEKLLGAIRAWTSEHGAPPTTRAWAKRDPGGRWPAAASVQQRFGTWDDALSAAQVEFVPQVRWDRESVIHAISRFAAEHGRGPRASELRPANQLPDRSTVERHCDSVVEALAAAGCPLSSGRVWDRAGMLDALAEFASEHGRAPTWTEWKRGAAEHPPADAVSAEFGSWAEAVRAAGLRPIGQPFDRDEVVSALRAWMIANGRAPKPADWRPDPARGVPPLSAIRRHFGKWDRAVRAAAEGLELPNLPEPGRPVYEPAERWAPRGTWSRDRVVAALQDWAREFGEPPLVEELSPAGAEWLASPHRERAQVWMREHPRWPSAAAVRRYFDSWAEALEAAGLPVRYGPGEFDLPLAERVGAARRMDAAGHGKAAIARELGVSESSVYNYLRAGFCPDCGGPLIQRTSRRCPACSARATLRPRFDRDETLALMRAWEMETGAPPMDPEWQPTADQRTRWGREYPRWPSDRTVVTHFGSWNAALEAAGFPLRRRTWNREAVIAGLRRFAEVHGRPPLRSELLGDSNQWPSASVVERHFGSFHEGMAAAGFSAPRVRSWSRDEIAEFFRAFAAEHGHPPSSRDLSSRSTRSRPSAATVYRQFGSWHAALEAAGFRPRLQAWPRAHVIAALREFAARHGRPPRHEELRAASDPPLPRARWRGASADCPRPSPPPGSELPIRGTGPGDRRRPSYRSGVVAVAVDELLEAYREAPTLEAAERVLHSIESSEQAREVGIGDLYDHLAEIAAEEDDFGLAVRAQRRAIDLGCEMPVLGRQMLGWYLMKDGQLLAGEAEFEALRCELGDDPELLITLGSARSDAGHEVEALQAFDEALAAARESEDDYAIDRARAERRECRSELGMPVDDEDRLARAASLFAPSREQVALAVGWFPRDECAAALERWPELEEDLADADTYCRGLDARLHELLRTTGRHPLVAPLRVEELIEHAGRRGLDLSDPSARAGLAADLARRGGAGAWPPARNEPCWCGSGRKYKRCCAA